MTIEGDGDEGKSWRRQRKLVTMEIEGSNTPEVVLARTLEKAIAGHIEAVVIGVHWKEDSDGGGGGMTMDWSQTKLSNLSTLARVINCTVDGWFQEILRDADEGDAVPDEGS